MKSFNIITFVIVFLFLLCQLGITTVSVVNWDKCEENKDLKRTSRNYSIAMISITLVAMSILCVYSLYCYIKGKKFSLNFVN